MMLHGQLFPARLAGFAGRGRVDLVRSAHGRVGEGIFVLGPQQVEAWTDAAVAGSPVEFEGEVFDGTAQRHLRFDVVVRLMDVGVAGARVRFESAGNPYRIRKSPLGVDGRP